AAITCALSATCGTHLGETKLIASIAGRPASVRRSIRPTLTSVGTTAFSFCKPSRGATSTMRTRCGSLVIASSVDRIGSEIPLGVDDAGDRQSGLEPGYLGGDLRDRLFDQRDRRHMGCDA